MLRIRNAAATFAISAALVGGGLTLGALPASANTASPAVSANIQEKVWIIWNFFPDEGTCEAQRRWGASQGWWTWDGSACATNGRDWALFIRIDAALDQDAAVPDLPEGWRRG
ncbi:hypothetical protein [Nonomuraea sp. NPDC005650]|uniref:hypothetical protein n=1 Tax=Nonomuraea sp. NPDC005650 TaxID=3157045 RepID=UPI0033BA0B26